MKNKISFIAILGLLNLTSAIAQNASTDSLQKEVAQIKKDVSALKRFKFSGYIQPQFQIVDSAGAASVAGGSFAPGLKNRFMIRRGRLKGVYSAAENSKGITTSQFTLQIDVTERGMVIKEGFAKFTDPWKGIASVSMGMFNNPFGFEVGYSSALRETPEFGRMSQTLFPNEMEVGAMLTLQGPKKTKWNKYKLDIAMVNGNNAPGYGVDVSDFDSKKDLIARASTEQSFKDGKVLLGAGVSYYAGGYRIDSVNVYKMGKSETGDLGFLLDTRAVDNGAVSISNRGFTERTYMGAELRFTYKSKAGATTLRGEYMTGQQPGSSTSSRSPNDKTPITKDTYNREFAGAYCYLIHALPKLPLEFVVKYDFYDPNTEISGNEIGKVPGTSAKATNETDFKYSTLGFGINWYYDQNLRLMAYFDSVKNETSTSLSGWGSDKQDNVFTLRMQVKF
ncbi:MAG: porin [Bacteroidia bacterium]